MASSSTTAAQEYLTASHWGLFYAQVRDGRLVGARAFEKDAAPSPNLGNIVELPYCAARIRKPMVRAGYLKDGPKSRDRRGLEDFVPVSWDQALDLAAAAINHVYEDYGPSSVWGRSYGWKSTGAVNSSIGLLQRMLNLKGGYLLTGNSYSTGAIGTIQPYSLGAKDPRGTDWESILEAGERIVLWGCDPVVTNDIDWNTTLHETTPIFRSLKNHPRIQVIAINPLRPQTIKEIGGRWIGVRPGTDCAMMAAMMYVLVQKGLAAEEFLQKCVTGWPQLRAYVLGEEDGVAKTPRWAENECGVSAQQIENLALELASHRTMIMMGWGPQRARYGEQAPWMALALACVMGQVGLPGGGYGSNYHYCNGGWRPAVGPMMAEVPAFVKPVVPVKPWRGSRAVPVARVADVLANPGKVIAWNGSRIEYPEIQLVYWAGGNPFAHHPNTSNLERAWRRPETVIVSDSVWSPTARHADIVLPVATFLERNDISFIGSYVNDGIVRMKQAIAPVGEARSDYKIFSAIAQRIGVGDAFTEGRSEMDWIRKLYEDARARGPLAGFELPTFEEFEEKGVVLYPRPPVKPYVALDDFRADPAAHPLKTETGKIVLYSEKIANLGYGDCPPHPTYLRPFTGYGNDEHRQEAEREEPLVASGDYLELVAPKSPARLHSQLNPVTHQRSEVQGREMCCLNPKDAVPRGIADGDVVRIANDRGAVLAGVCVTTDVRPGAVVLRHGGWFDPQTCQGREVDVHGCVNVLTPDDPASSLSNGNIASTARVRVQKWTQPLPAVRVFQAPAVVN